MLCASTLPSVKASLTRKSSWCIVYLASKEREYCCRGEQANASRSRAQLPDSAAFVAPGELRQSVNHFFFFCISAGLSYCCRAGFWQVAPTPARYHARHTKDKGQGTRLDGDWLHRFLNATAYAGEATTYPLKHSNEVVSPCLPLYWCTK